MFESVQMAPPDAILGLTEAFKKDPNPDKINLAVGIYLDAQGKTPVLASVKAAEKWLLENEKSKTYLPIEGSQEYAKAVMGLLLGDKHEVIANKLAISAHTPGGTGALRVAGDYIKKLFPSATVWMSDPTWPNHPQIFNAAGLATRSYPYFDAASNSVAFDKLIAALKQIPAGDVVLLHGCCHNPTGADPTPDQWRQIAQVLRERKALPLIDFAYQGFAEGVADDAACLKALCTAGAELLICSSFSKNFSLYNERVGALTAVAATAEAAQAVLSQIKSCIRANYSNPPAHGAAIVTTILSQPNLAVQWHDEVKAMRDRINGMRQLFVKTLKAKGVSADLSFITRQRGMFSFSGLNKQQVERLKQEFGVYVVGSGRINVAGMTADNMDRLCDAIAAVSR